jgi:hypothetical protein
MVKFSLVIGCVSVDLVSNAPEAVIFAMVHMQCQEGFVVYCQLEIPKSYKFVPFLGAKRCSISRHCVKT